MLCDFSSLSLCAFHPLIRRAHLDDKPRCQIEHNLGLQIIAKNEKKMYFIEDFKNEGIENKLYKEIN